LNRGIDRERRSSTLSKGRAMLSTDRNPNGIIANSFLECWVEVGLKEHLDSGKICRTPLMKAEIHTDYGMGIHIQAFVLLEEFL